MIRLRTFKLLLVMLLFFQLQACSDSGKNTLVSNVELPRSGAKAPMSGFAGDEQMLASLRKAARAESEQSQFVGLAEAEASTQDSGASSSAQSVTSTTNVQVLGVDEADLVKVVGERLFALTAPQYSVGTGDTEQAQSPQDKSAALKQFQLSAPARLLEATDLPAGVQWQGLYNVANDELLVLQGVGSSSVSNVEQSSYWWGESSVELRAIGSGVEDQRAQPVWQISFDGRLVGSRRIGDTLYIVTEYGAPYIHPFAESTGNVDELSLSDWLPHWQLDGADKGSLVASTDCYVSQVDERRQTTRVTSVVAIPLREPASLTTRCVLGTAETLFVSQAALYIGTTESYFEGAATSPVDIFFPTDMNTDIHKFSFDDTLSYRGGVRLAGHLGWHPQQRSYRMGERDGVLSVVTSGSSAWFGSEQNHRLYTLHESAQGFELRAELPNDSRPAAIGKPGERIYGTRALGDKVYVVTFLNTDPLYVIDVSNASDPFIAGELEVPGFSDYLHPVAEGRLLGIGKSARSADGGDDGRGGWYQGLRLSLFDVADPSSPTLINALEYGDRGTSSDLFRDFHALAWLDKNDGSSEFALPVDLYRHSSAPKYPWQYGQFVHRGLYRFKVTDTGLSELATALLPNDEYYGSNARSVLSSDGAVWFYDHGELYYASANAPAMLIPSD